MKAPSPWADRWQTVRLGHLLAPSIRTGEPDLDVLSVYRDYGVIRKDSRSDNFNRTPADLSRYQVVNPGDVVVNRMKAWQGSLGISAFQGLVSPDYDVLRPTTNQWETRFLNHVLRSRPMIDEYAVRSTGIRPSQWRLYWAQMRTIPVPVPTLGEQRAIADYLDRETARIDTLIQEQQRLVEMLGERRAAVIESTVAKLDWQIPLGSVTTLIQTGPFGSQLKSDEYVEGGVPVINPSHLVGGVVSPDRRVAVDGAKAESLSRHFLREGDVVAARRGELGRCAVVDDQSSGFICGTGSVLIRPDHGRLNARFLVLAFGSRRNKDALSLASVGSTMENLNAVIVSALRIPVPPIDEQCRIVNHLDQQIARIDVLIAETERFIELSRERRSALITAAVTGQIDVRGEVA